MHSVEWLDCRLADDDNHPTLTFSFNTNYNATLNISCYTWS